MRRSVIFFLAAAGLLVFVQPGEAGDYLYYRQYRPVVRRYYCPPPGNVYRNYQFRGRWYYYGPYCGPRILPPVIAVPLPVVKPGYYVDVQCTVCKRWWRWRTKYPGQRPKGLPPCWKYH